MSWVILLSPAIYRIMLTLIQRRYKIGRRTVEMPVPKPLLRYLKACGGLIIVSGFLAAALGGFQMPTDKLTAWRLGGASLIIGGLLGSWSAYRELARHRSQLVVSGPYQLIRNPHYIATGVSALGLTLLTWNVAYGAGLFVIVVLLFMDIEAEEASLRDHFGQAYINYTWNTGRFLPKWRQWRS